MAEELNPCPSCGALPCDWVDNPHAALARRTEAHGVLVSNDDLTQDQIETIRRMTDPEGKKAAKRNPLYAVAAPQPDARARIAELEAAWQRIAVGDGIGGPDAEVQCADIAFEALKGSTDADA